MDDVTDGGENGNVGGVPQGRRHMLIRRVVLERIRDGEVSLAFRRWLRPSVRGGGRLRTALGELEIREVAAIDPSAITEGEAVAAGYDSVEALRAELDQRPGTVYRVAFGSLRPDSRIALREDDQLAPEELAALQARLDGMDARAPGGPWTRQTLRLIGDHPGVRAGDLAPRLGQEKEVFKVNVRKLKNLGLTESLGTGYRISKRGGVVLKGGREGGAGTGRGAGGG